MNNSIDPAIGGTATKGKANPSLLLELFKKLLK